MQSVSTECAVHGCYRPVYRRRWCGMHYRRVIRYGGTGPAYEIGKAASLEDRFENAVQSDGVCFLWHGSVSKNGYGTIGFKGRKLYAHRVAWQLAHGEYPLGRISWTCGQRLCVRADHLKQG